jgi:hypothetical protein
VNGGHGIAEIDAAALLSRASTPSVVAAIHEPGIYAISLAPSSVLSGIIAGKDGVLYIGMTSATLDARSHFRHSHSGFSTFRRSLGALLKDELDLTAIPRGAGASASNFRNYRFSDFGEQALTNWMNRNLLMAQAAVAANVAELEMRLIAELKPPLNLTGWPNPQRTALKTLRAKCADEARRQRT